MRENPLQSVRTALKAARQDYAMAMESRFRRTRPGVSAQQTAGDWHIRSEANLMRSREYIRDMHRNDFAIGATTRKAVQQQIQGGFRPDPSTGDKKLDLDLWQRWTAWATDRDACDMAGEREFADFEAAIFEAMLVDGDCFPIGTSTGHLQLIEADQIRTPTKLKRNIVYGVELNDYRKHLVYYRAKDQIGTDRRYERLYDFDEIAVRSPQGVRQAFHVANPDRVTQTRGLSAYKAVADIGGMLDDVNFALVVKQQFASALAWFLERSDKAGGYESDVQFGSRTTITRADGGTDHIDKIEPGQFIKGKPGEKLLAISGNIPSTETMQHIRFLLQVIGINLGLPLVLVMLDAKETNFSGWRAAMDMARLGFRCNQQALVRRFHKPVYRLKLHQWADADPALRTAMDRMGVAFFNHRWHTPTWPYIDPLKDVNANALRLSTGLASERQIAAEDGRDYDDIVDEHIADRSRSIYRAAKAAKRLTKKTGFTIGWRDVLNQDLPKGGQTFDSADIANPEPTAVAPVANTTE